MYLAEDRVQWRTLVNRLVRFRITEISRLSQERLPDRPTVRTFYTFVQRAHKAYLLSRTLIRLDRVCDFEPRLYCVDFGVAAAISAKLESC
jgi:hypothetical protein